MKALQEHWGKLLLAALLLLGAGLAYRSLRGPEVTAVEVASADLVQTVLVSGRVLPPAEVQLVGRLEAQVLEVHVEVGDRVEAGALLVQLDATAAEAEVSRARAMLARAQATSGRSRQIAPQVAQQGLTTAQVQLEESRRTLEQAQRLVSSGAWPEDRVTQAQDAVTRARSQERSARLELRAARGADQAAAAAGVEEALAALALADERLAHTAIRAPVAGVVLERSIEVGDTARPGVAAVRIAADGPPILSVDPDERHLSQLTVGQNASVVADAYLERPFEAAVTFIAPAVDPDRGTVEIRLLPREEIDFLRPNLTVSVEIEVARAADALAVPARLVTGAATDSPTVWVAEDGRLARRPIELGLRGHEMLQVLDGLEAGERVLAFEDASLDVGSRVRVAP